MDITYYGHSCFVANIGDKKLLFDPFITPNELAKDKVKAEEVEADYILLSHAHADHVADCMAIAKRTNAMVVSNFEIIEWLKKEF